MNKSDSPKKALGETLSGRWGMKEFLSARLIQQDKH